MCHNSILPTTLNAEQFGTELNRLIYVFNRWLKMLSNYGRLNPDERCSDFSLISKVIKNADVKRDVREAVRRCRDYALSRSVGIDELARTLKSALRILCKTQENSAVEEVAQTYADQGMTERYRPLSRKLAKEKIHKINRKLICTDASTDDRETTRLVRRIVEKRAAQTVYRNMRHRDRESNKFRQSVRRATSFSLYNKKFADYDIQLRAHGTHWKVRHNCRGEKILEAKVSYNTYEEAAEAILRYSERHPDDQRPMTAYVCDHCGKWHIGHVRAQQHLPEPEEMDIQEAG